jgi:hypothetical protein
MPGTLFDAPEEAVEPYRGMVERYYGNDPVPPENIIPPGKTSAPPVQNPHTLKSPFELEQERRAKASKEKKPEESEEKIDEDATPVSPLDKIRKRAQAASHKEAYSAAPHDRAME